MSLENIMNALKRILKIPSKRKNLKQSKILTNSKEGFFTAKDEGNSIIMRTSEDFQRIGFDKKISDEMEEIIKGFEPITYMVTSITPKPN